MKKLALALTVATIASQASAAPATLDTITNSGSGVYVIEAAENSTWDFDIANMVMTSTGTTARGLYVPSKLNEFQFVNLAFDLGAFDLNGSVGSTTAASFECVEGEFGALVTANICGNYSLNNFGDESSIAYNVGGDPRNTVVIIGGDDTLGTLAGSSPYSLQFYDVFSYTWDGVNLVVSTVGLGLDGTTGTTYDFAFTVVPVPAAAWLFGSALLGLAGLKRKQ